MCKEFISYFRLHKEFVVQNFQNHDETKIITALEDLGSFALSGLTRQYPRLSSPFSVKDEFNSEVNHVYILKLNVQVIMQIYSALLTETSVIIISDDTQVLVHLMEVMCQFQSAFELTFTYSHLKAYYIL